MALKTGTENKRNVAIVVVLLCVVGYLVVQQFTGPSTPKPVAPPPQPVVTVRQAPQTPAIRTTSTGAVPVSAAGPAARQLPGNSLDPALHLEKLATSESIEYAGIGRNIFSGEAEVAPVEEAVAPARPAEPVVPVYTPPAVPQAPPIELKYFGYSATKSGAREAYLVHGDDIFAAAAGEIVNHRYKVVAVDAHSIQITDLSYNNTQTLQLAN